MFRSWLAKEFRIFALRTDSLPIYCSMCFFAKWLKVFNLNFIQISWENACSYSWENSTYYELAFYSVWELMHNLLCLCLDVHNLKTFLEHVLTFEEMKSTYWQQWGIWSLAKYLGCFTVCHNTSNTSELFYWDFVKEQCPPFTLALLNKIIYNHLIWLDVWKLSSI